MESRKFFTKRRVKDSVKVQRTCFTAVFEPDGNGWMGYIEELPGANTQGKTLTEARKNLKEAVKLIIETNRKLARRESHGKHIIREQLLVTL